MHLVVNLIVLLLGYFRGVAALNCFSLAKDVCNGELLETPNISSRYPEYAMTPETSHWTFCDVYSINTSQWYKSEEQMSTNCPYMYACGTKFPIWLDGRNPKLEEGVVNRTACVRYFETCCLYKYTLTAVNCGKFMAYCFVDLPSSCHQRYCFDNGQDSTTGHPNTNTNDLSTSPDVDTTSLDYLSRTTQESDTYTSMTTNADMTSLKYSRTTSQENFINTSITANLPSSTLQHSSSSDGTPNSSVGVTDTSTFSDRTSWKYSTTTTTTTKTTTRPTHVRTTKTTTGLRETSIAYDVPSDDHNLLIIALSVIGLLVAVICGLLIYINRRRRVPKSTDEAKKVNVYDTLKISDTTKTKESESEYRIVTFDNPNLSAGQFGVYNDSTKNYKTRFSNTDYQLTYTEKQLYDEDEHYLTLP